MSFWNRLGELNATILYRRDAGTPTSQVLTRVRALDRILPPVNFRGSSELHVENGEVLTPDGSSLQGRVWTMSDDELLHVGTVSLPQLVDDLIVWFRGRDA